MDSKCATKLYCYRKEMIEHVGNSLDSKYLQDNSIDEMCVQWGFT